MWIIKAKQDEGRWHGQNSLTKSQKLLDEATVHPPHTLDTMVVAGPSVAGESSEAVASAEDERYRRETDGRRHR